MLGLRKRDRALLCLLIGCGLCREELAQLAVEHIQQRDARWVLVDLAGKGKKGDRIVGEGMTAQSVFECVEQYGPADRDGDLPA